MLDVAKQMLYKGREVMFQQAPSAGGCDSKNNSTSHTSSSWIFILPLWNSVNISLSLYVTPVKNTPNESCKFTFNFITHKINVVDNNTR